jgi:predicted kinase/diadenosine tetraphosphatase ApaH/serine/threonine PP2A family protein phosphatase
MSRSYGSPSSPGLVLEIPAPSLVVMVGPAGSGKTSFCERNFLPAQVVSSDRCGGLAAGDPSDAGAIGSALDPAHRILSERLQRGHLTVFDATSVTTGARRALLDLAARHHVPAVACVLNLPVDECAARDRSRPDRRVGRPAIARQARQLEETLPRIEEEGFAAVHRIDRPDEAVAARVELVPLPCDRSDEKGPFDVIGDVHGCARELEILLRRLGYARRSARGSFRHPGGRRAVFVGDLVDRGPQIVRAVRTVMAMVAARTAFSVPGNHEVALLRCLDGGAVAKSPGLVASLRQIDELPRPRRRRFVEELRAFVASLPPHLVLDEGRLAVAHAGLKTDHVGRDSPAVRRFALHGETTGEIDRYGLPVRVQWASAYEGRALLVYGHTPVPAPEWIRNSVNVDTGCVYGGSLSALRYPEREIVAIPARRVYYRPRRSLPARVGLRAETRALPPAPPPFRKI